MALAPQGSVGPFGIVDTTIETGVRPGEGVASSTAFAHGSAHQAAIPSNGFLSAGLLQILSPGLPAEPLHFTHGLLFLWQL